MLGSPKDLTKLTDQRGKSASDDAIDTQSFFVKMSINPIPISHDENYVIALLECKHL